VTEAPVVPQRTGAWSSALSSAEFAATTALGLEPVGFVQGCSVVSWSFMGFGGGAMGSYGYGNTGGYSEQFSCPHGFVSAEHRLYGVNYEKTWIEQTWQQAFAGAYARLLADAEALGADGVIGVVERRIHHSENAMLEIALTGTAVRADGPDRPGHVFSTYLAGQKLTKLFEAGLVPVSIAAVLISIGVYESCVTELQLRGGSYTWGMAPVGEIEQLSRAERTARSLARSRLREGLGSDSLFGATLQTGEYESAQGPQIEVTLRGTRVRRFRPFAELPPPVPVVNLVDR
jgi:uncharacterized protein YbjQ (UPF0145 family)